MSNEKWPSGSDDFYFKGGVCRFRQTDVCKLRAELSAALARAERAEQERDALREENIWFRNTIGKYCAECGGDCQDDIGVSVCRFAGWENPTPLTTNYAERLRLAEEVCEGIIKKAFFVGWFNVDRQQSCILTETIT